VALLAGRHWRALGAALGSAAALCALSLVVFGWETWQGFLAAAAASHTTYASGRINFGGLITPFGGVLLAGGTPNAAYMAQAAATLGAGFLVAFVWRRGVPLPIRAAMLATATLVAFPVALIYDLMLGAVAAAWLVRDPAGLAGRVRLALAALFVLSMIPPGLAEAWHVPAGPIVALGLLALIAARALGTNSFAEEIATA
jgi:alpha-1,2-mannosyltransferase